MSQEAQSKTRATLGRALTEPLEAVAIDLGEDDNTQTVFELSTPAAPRRALLLRPRYPR